jgi:hypothetical protein
VEVILHLATFRVITITKMSGAYDTHGGNKKCGKHFALELSRE